MGDKIMGNKIMGNKIMEDKMMASRPVSLLVASVPSLSFLLCGSLSLGIFLPLA